MNNNDITDNILSIILLLFIISILVYLIYKNFCFCKKKESFSEEIDCSKCNCNKIQKQKDFCDKPYMYDVNDPARVDIGKAINNGEGCYDWKCYENCDCNPNRTDTEEA